LFGQFATTLKRPSAMSKPPKPTPKNMEWGGVSKSVSLLKTSVFQKLAGSKSKEVPPEFLQLTLKVKTLKKLLDELITLSRHYTKTIVGAYHLPCVLSALALFLPPYPLSYFEYTLQLLCSGYTPQFLQVLLPPETLHLTSRCIFALFKVILRAARNQRLHLRSFRNVFLLMMSWVRRLNSLSWHAHFPHMPRFEISPRAAEVLRHSNRNRAIQDAIRSYLLRCGLLLNLVFPLINKLTCSLFSPAYRRTISLVQW
jgi:hypothetical protein